MAYSVLHGLQCSKVPLGLRAKATLEAHLFACTMTPSLSWMKMSWVKRQQQKWHIDYGMRSMSLRSYWGHARMMCSRCFLTCEENRLEAFYAQISNWFRD